jgi:hypothetical protein
VAIEVNLVQKTMNFVNGSAIPQSRIATAEFFVRNSTGQPLVQEVAGCRIPDSQPFMNVLPGTRHHCESAVKVKNN